MDETSNPVAHPRKKKAPRNQTAQSQLQSALATCTKANDLPTALSLYQNALSQNLHLTPSHFNSLLYLCSSSHDPSISTVETGFQIFDRMIAASIAPSEATLTAVARLAAAKSDGDLAFRLIKENASKYGILLRLRTYGPALFAFCAKNEAEKAYEVEEEMIANGVSPEEVEISGLLKVSAEMGRGDKVYVYLQKMRNAVKCVKEETAEVIGTWFKNEAAAEVGGLSSDWNVGSVQEAVLRNGGGWHGLGWLGTGRWYVCRSRVGIDGVCGCCGERLVCVDAGKEETVRFAGSIVELAMEREAKSGFGEFKEWLDKHAEYEAVVDGANIGFYQQNFAEGRFSLSQLNTVVKELYERSQKKWPLVLLHTKRVRALMEIPSNRELIEEWRARGALYTTPTGSNDDWYWLYAAVKLKCLLVTNDEMRDHIFELLGSSFFLKWKERHQESEKGSWHIPIEGECGSEELRTWLCITRRKIDGPGEIPISLDAHLNGPIARCNQKAADCGTIVAENDIQNFSTASQLLGDKTSVVTGKRKDRSPSPPRLQ
ncbi:proteinaceous RNase P 2 isoform X2 [Magnolia sinica]|uniref:proteinaceous RNase P 2 isoform X2 n=1 Tax=Magnolia sinica TaxID=86752 RepID=UPI00265A9596|nr:proteinaceous RNase P 2 isoform X2 [Magnolia sinica]